MRWFRVLTTVLLMLVVVWMVPSCQQAQQERAEKMMPEPNESMMHEGFTYDPMSSDRIIWKRSRETKDSTGEEWVRGLGTKPNASWQGCPCCPVAIDSGGCCLPCLVYGKARYEGSDNPKGVSNEPTKLITIEHRFPTPGTVFATAACQITRDPQSTDPLEVLFGLTKDGSPDMAEKGGSTEVLREIPPAADLGGEGKWIQFRQEFHVDSAATSFSLVGRAPKGVAGDMVGIRIIDLTFLPDLN